MNSSTAAIIEESTQRAYSEIALYLRQEMYVLLSDKEKADIKSIVGSVIEGIAGIKSRERAIFLDYLRYTKAGRNFGLSKIVHLAIRVMESVVDKCVRSIDEGVLMDGVYCTGLYLVAINQQELYDFPEMFEGMYEHKVKHLYYAISLAHDIFKYIEQ